MEYRIDAISEWAADSYNRWRIYQSPEGAPGAHWAILVGGQAQWDTRANAEAYLARFIGEKDAACARAALGVAE